MDVSDIKFENAKITSAIRCRSGLTKKEIAAVTEPSFSTASNICNVLLEKGTLTNQKSEGTSIGRTGCIELELSRVGMNERGDTADDSEFYRDRGTKLGRLLAIIANLFDPDMIYLGGIAFQAYPEMEPYVLQELSASASFVMARSLTIQHDLDSTASIYQGINQVIYDHWTPLE